MKVSICTSVLNQSEYLRRMILSVQAQTFTDWELIIVDDGSTENIKGLVEDIGDSRIVYTRLPENRGIPHGLNYAFTLATGEYIQPLSADEWITPDKLEVQVAYLDENQSIGCVWGLPGKGEMGKRPSYEQYTLLAHNRSREAWIRTLLRFENIPIGGASMLMRREIMQELGGFDPQFFHCSDLELFVRFFQKWDGRILCYRFADADQPDTRLTAPSAENAERFREDVTKLHVKHQIVLPQPGRVTVGIPVYNMAKFIPQALDSLLCQSVQDFDIIVLDDCSTDNLLEVLQPYASRINLVKFEENSGVRKAVNAMLSMCETPFFTTLAADDWLDPTYIERCMGEFIADPFLEFVATQTDFYDESGAPIPPGTHHVQGIPQAANKPRDQWLHLLYYGNHYFGAGMYRTNALREIGGFNVEDGVLCDYDVYLKLLHRENIKIVEAPLTHTRIHDGNASIGPGKIDAQWLKEKYHEIRSRYFAPRMKVIIATPFYEMKGYSPYISSLAQTIQILTKIGIEHEWWELSGDSYVERAKNTIMNKFLEDPAATDLFMIDADMQWNVDGFINILKLPEEIVQGSYPQKNQWDKFTAIPVFVAQEDGRHHPVGRELPGGTALIKAAYLAGGFLRMKRSALQKYKDHYTDLVYYDGGADPSKPDRLYTQFFNCELRKNEEGISLRWGEDRIFGLRMNAIGIDTWIYPNIEFGHYGVKGWMGNYHRFLREGATVKESVQ